MNVEKETSILLQVHAKRAASANMKEQPFISMHLLKVRTYFGVEPYLLFENLEIFNTCSKLFFVS